MAAERGRVEKAGLDTVGAFGWKSVCSLSGCRQERWARSAWLSACLVKRFERREDRTQRGAADRKLSIIRSQEVVLSRVLFLAGLLALPAFAAEPTLYGRYEHIKVEEIGKILPAKMDTGAMTASLSARDIEQFKRDGEDWVRFRLAVDGADDTLYEQRLLGISRIKTRAEEAGNVDPDSEPPRAERPVVGMQLCIGDQLREVQVNLTDRTHFSYPLLIGAETIRDLNAAIYPTEKYTAGQPAC